MPEEPLEAPHEAKFALMQYHLPSIYGNYVRAIGCSSDKENARIPTETDFKNENPASLDGWHLRNDN